MNLEKRIYDRSVRAWQSKALNELVRRAGSRNQLRAKLEIFRAMLHSDCGPISRADLELLDLCEEGIKIHSRRIAVLAYELGIDEFLASEGILP